jgi:hypothetical protein
VKLKKEVCIKINKNGLRDKNIEKELPNNK